MSRDLTDEAQQLLENILKYDEIKKKIKVVNGKRIVVENIPEDDLPELTRIEKDHLKMKMEITNMIINSEMVIEDCNLILSSLTDAEEYMNSDAKVAKTLHTRIVERLYKVLNGQPAFEDERHLQIKIEQIRVLHKR